MPVGAEDRDCSRQTRRSRFELCPVQRITFFTQPLAHTLKIHTLHTTTLTITLTITSMSANAAWGKSSPVAGAKNAIWGTPSGAGKSRKVITHLLSQKFGLEGPLEGQTPVAAKKLGAAVSTSALANLQSYQQYQRPAAHLSSPVPEGPDDDEDRGKFTISRKKVQLRQETLESLGISIQRRHNPRGHSPKGVLKKSGSAQALARSNTLTNLKRVPTEIELSNGRVLKRNTSVTFNERVRCKGVESASSLAEDPKDLWFQDDEMASIRRNAKSAVKEIEKGYAQPDTDAFCLRGLERHLPGAKEESRMRMEDTWDAVLGAQEVFLEHQGEYCDNDKIEILVRNISRQSLKEAQERAKLDATDATYW